MTNLSPDTRALTGVDDLLAAGLAPADQAGDLAAVAQDFQIRITPAMRHAITAPGDGVAAQFVPDPRELTVQDDELTDPIGDDAHSPVPGLTHRYPDRVILHVTRSCAVYCRFCFRREVVGETGPLPDADLDAALAYIAAHPAITEVILTGGDPLTLSARRLNALLARLDGIAHVGVIRFHTRIPAVAPDRITPALIDALRDLRAMPVVVLHINHAAELTPPARAALARLADGGVMLLSQSVLLRGVNADADTLAALFRALIRNRVKPYYLHHCDRARGTSHFRTSIAEGQAIMAALRGRISGICLPTYVLDLPGGHGKVPIGPNEAVETTPGIWEIRDWQGHPHRYDEGV